MYQSLFRQIHRLPVSERNSGKIGAFLKPYRRYVSNKTLRRTKENIRRLNMEDEDAVFRSVNSFLGTLVHNKSYNIRRELFLNDRFLKVGIFDKDITKFELRKSA